MRAIHLFTIFSAIGASLASSASGQNNTNCANAIALSNNAPFSENTSIVGSTNVPSIVCGSGFGRGVWFTLTPTNTGRINLTTCGSSFQTSLIVYTNTCGNLSNALDYDGSVVCSGPGNPFGCTGGRAGLTFDGVSNVTYTILAGGYGAQSGVLQITVNMPDPPANDRCANAIPLFNNVPVSVVTTNATEFGEPTVVCGSGFGRGVWFTLTPTNTGRVNLTTCGSSFQTSLIVYTNTCGNLSNALDYDGSVVCSGPGNPFGCTGGRAGLTFDGVSNVTYTILVGGYGAQSGVLEITANMPDPPANDRCANAIPLFNNVPVSVVTTNATEFGEPTVVCGSGFGRGVWFTLTPTNTGRVNLTTCGSSFQTSLIVYTNTCGSLSNALDYDGSVVCSGPGNPFGCTGGRAGLTFDGVSNVTYTILAGGYGAQSGVLQITANMPDPPANDRCANAIPLFNNVPVSVVTTNATEFGEPTVVCGSGFGRGVWFTLTPTNTGRVNLTTCGSSFQTSLIVYTNPCGNLSNLVCSAASDPFNCGSARAGVSFNAIGNTAYYILAGGYGAQSGLLQITANVPPPTNDLCSGAIAMTPGTTYSVSTFYATEAGDPIPTNCVPTLRGGVWYSYQPAVSGPVGVTTCGSDFDTVLAVYTGTCGSAFTNVACSHAHGGLCNNVASIVFNGIAGTKYYILAGGNNGAVGNLQVLIPIVDLVPTGLTASNSTGGLLTAGRQFNASWTVQNQGFNSISGSWIDSLTISNASTNILLATFNSGHTASAGSGYSESVFRLQLPQIPGGNYSLIAQADTDNAVVETNENNNAQVLSVIVTSLPPVIALSAPTNETDRESCVAIRFPLLAQTQPGSYTITNVIFFNGSTNNIIGSRANPPYSTLSLALEFGTNVIGAAAMDNFGLVGFSTNVATIIIHYPTNLHVLRGDLATNGDFVGCMCAYSGSNYLVESTTNLSSPIPWPPYVTNQAVANVLAFTNQPSTSQRFFRARLLP